MAFCRWSTNDFQCDLYVFADVHGGYTIHVADNRRQFTQPLPPEVKMDDDIKAWLDSTMIPIDLPLHGESFYCQTKERTIQILTELKEIGYNFPEEVIDAIREDEE